MQWLLSNKTLAAILRQHAQGFVLSQSMTPNGTQEWYALLHKPWFAPPAWVFAPVWSVLYILIAVSFGYVFLKVIRRQWPAKVALPFGINLVANLLYTPLQFGLHSNVLALVDILIILLTIPWMMYAVWQRVRWVSSMQVPYFLWVAFATVLQVCITWLNL